jgi:processive 1,2-diacylglycerol beta-glucosyltransferase
MVKVYNNETGDLIGEVEESQLRLLTSMLEEESLEDTDYYLNEDTILMLEGEGAEPGFIAMLRRALGDRGDLEIRWEEAP